MTILQVFNHISNFPYQEIQANLILFFITVSFFLVEFAFTYYSATISELAPVSSEVTRVLATSKDIGVNAEITYDIVGGNGYSHFGVHPKTGVIFVSSPLDYERIREYVLAIRARDGGSPPLASQALVNISLIDQNDNAPQFSSGSSSYSVQIPEDAAIGTSVIQVGEQEKIYCGMWALRLLLGTQDLYFSSGQFKLYL